MYIRLYIYRRGDTYCKLVKPLKAPSGTLVSWLLDRSRLLWSWQTWADAFMCTLSHFAPIPSAGLLLEQQKHKDTDRRIKRQIDKLKGIANTHTCTRMDTCSLTYTRTITQTRKHSQTHTQTNTRTRTHTQKHAHTRKHTHTYTHTHTRRYKYVYIHMHVSIYI